MTMALMMTRMRIQDEGLGSREDAHGLDHRDTERERISERWTELKSIEGQDAKAYPNGR